MEGGRVNYRIWLWVHIVIAMVEAWMEVVDGRHADDAWMDWL